MSTDIRVGSWRRRLAGIAVGLFVLSIAGVFFAKVDRSGTNPADRGNRGLTANDDAGERPGATPLRDTGERAAGGATWLGPDWTVDDLVMGHDLIVIGTVGAAISTDLSPNDQEMLHEYPAVPTEAWADFEREPYTQFEFTVEEVLLDRLSHVGRNKPVILFTPLGPPYPQASTPPDGYVRTGDRFLTVLTLHDDPDWPANLFVTWDLHRDCINVDGPQPADAMGQPVPSAAGMTTAEFLDELALAIARVYGTP